MSETEKKNVQLVKVYVRQRPFTKDETELRIPSIIKNIAARDITLKLNTMEKKYTFDKVFGDTSSQAEIYEIVVHPLIDFIINGYNCTVFAYGQTGTGKTHTMIGSNIGITTDFNNDPSVGMIPRAASHLFTLLNQQQDKIEYTVTLSFIEIYNEEVRDLLRHDGEPLRIYDDPENKGSICIKNLVEETICNPREVYEWLIIGTRERQTAETNLNRHSSRSHTIFTLIVHTSEVTKQGEEIIKTGKLHLIDLAGNENIGRSGAVDMRAREAGTINRSLLTLGKVVKALAQKQSHIPYRDSKLTRILQDSLGGKTKTCMIATFSPCSNAWDETVSSLDYAQVTRSVVNCPQVNVNRKQVNIVKDLKDQLFRLRQELSAARTGTGFYMTETGYTQMTQNLAVKKQRILDLMKEIQLLEETRALKEQQYRERNKSFLKTKSYLERLQKELEDKKLKERQNKYVLNYIDGRGQELNETAEQLLKVCETSTKHEQIYHNKYEAQCLSTLNNAKIAETICSTANGCVRDIDRGSQQYFKDQKSYMSDIKEIVKIFNNAHSENLGLLEDLLLALQTATTNFGLTFDKVVHCDSSQYGEDRIRDKIDTIFASIGLLQLNWQKDITNSVAILKHEMFTENTDIEAKAAHCLKTIVTECEKKVECFDEMNNLLESFKKSLLKRNNNIEAQIRRNNKVVEVFESYLARKEEEEENTLAEVASLKLEMEQISLVLREYEDQKHLLTANEELVDIKQRYHQNTKTQISMLENAVGILKNSEECSKEQVASNTQELQEHFSGLINTIKGNLQFYNTATKDSLSGLINQASHITENTTDYIDSIEAVTKDMSNSTSTYNTNLKIFLKVSSNNLQGLTKNVVLTAHQGDTPEKVKYNYPKTIKSRIPHEVLVEQFMATSETENCQNGV